MIFQRFGLICLGSMLFGVWFAVLIQDVRADRAGRGDGGLRAACPAMLHPACDRPVH